MKRLTILSIFTLLSALNIYGSINYLPDGRYDSSADYWRVIVGQDNDVSVEWDFSNDVTVEMADGSIKTIRKGRDDETPFEALARAFGSSHPRGGSANADADGIFQAVIAGLLKAGGSPNLPADFERDALHSATRNGGIQLSLNAAQAKQLLRNVNGEVKDLDTAALSAAAVGQDRSLRGTTCPPNSNPLTV